MGIPPPVFPFLRSPAGGARSRCSGIAAQENTEYRSPTTEKMPHRADLWVTAAHVDSVHPFIRVAEGSLWAVAEFDKVNSVNCRERAGFA